MYLIYKITNKISNKIYIGYTSNLEKRWKEHIRDAQNNKPKHLYESIRLYGIENFSIDIIEDNIVTQIDALEKETQYIIKYNTLSKDGYGYNIDLYNGRKVLNGKILCTKCNTLKILKEFNKNKNASLGISSDCKICHRQSHHNRKLEANKIAKLWKQNNKESIKKYNKIYHKSKKYKMLKANRDLRYYTNNKEKILNYDKIIRLKTVNSIKGVYKELVLLYNNTNEKYCNYCKQIHPISDFRKSGKRTKTICNLARKLKYQNDKHPYSLSAIE